VSAPKTTRKRLPFAELGPIERDVIARTVAVPDLGSRDLKVLLGLWKLTLSWSKTSDKVSVSQIAEAAGMDCYRDDDGRLTAPRSVRRWIRESLVKLADNGVIEYRVSAGRYAMATISMVPAVGTLEDSNGASGQRERVPAVDAKTAPMVPAVDAQGTKTPGDLANPKDHSEGFIRRNDSDDEAGASPLTPKRDAPSAALLEDLRDAAILTLDKARKLVRTIEAESPEDAAMLRRAKTLRSNAGRLNSYTFNPHLDASEVREMLDEQQAIDDDLSDLDDEMFYGPPEGGNDQEPTETPS
jgi:hypothetical protein